MTLDQIPLYAVFEDGDLFGFSFDDAPGAADIGREHKPLDRADPGAPLLLAAFENPPAAAAFIAGLQYYGDDRCGCIMRSFTPALTCVLAEFFDGSDEDLAIEDFRPHMPKAGAA